MDHKKSFLGTGWGFPPSFDYKKRSSHMASDEEDIKQSLFIILSTSHGERVMNPEFGCDLFSTLFDAVDSLMINRIKDYVRTAILNFEPRITLDNVLINSEDTLDGILKIHLEYTIRKTNIRTNMVYPFYLKEGTNITGI